MDVARCDIPTRSGFPALGWGAGRLGTRHQVEWSHQLVEVLPRVVRTSKQSVLLRVKPAEAFGSPVVGETLFG